MFIIECPHCNGLVEIEAINCAIFRHAIYRDTGQQIPPHAPRDVCEQLLMDNKIQGCGKPFKLVLGEQGYQAVICDYI